MNRFRLTMKLMAIAVFMFAFASMTQAQATRTWVSGVGDDVNPCSRTAPCKTFAGAISKTAAGGEIDSLDPAGFGAVTITKSITIDGGGGGSGFGGILAAGTNGVIINDAASASPQTSIVRLRSLAINGAHTGFDGIRVLSARTVFIENCQIYGFRGNGTGSDGVEIAITAGSGTFTVSMKDTLIENNTGDGIRQSATGVTLNCSYDNVVIANNNKGLEALGGTGNISRSVITFNTGDGLSVAGGSVINASSNQVTSNGTGFNGISGTIRLSDNNIFKNGTGVAGGTFVTFGNNRLLGNTSDGTLPAATLQK
jgi:hypothetical protein